MPSLEDTIGYAIKIGEEFEVRIVNVRGEQKRVSLGASDELFANPQKIGERIRKEQYTQAR